MDGSSQKKTDKNGRKWNKRKILRKLEKAVAVRNSFLEKFSGKVRRCWKIIHRFSGSAKCYPCQGLGIFWQGKWLLENRPRLRERCWIFSSETATAFLSSPENQATLSCARSVLIAPVPRAALALETKLLHAIF